MKYLQRFSLIALTLLSGLAFANNDLKGATDHPLISRFAESHIVSLYKAEFAPFMIATGVKTEKKLPPVERFEGKVYSVNYKANDSKYSALQIYRNYETALNGAGFETIFNCSNDTECGRNFVRQLYAYGDPTRSGRYRYLDAPNTHGDRYTYYYWSGKKLLNEKPVYVTLLVVQRASGGSPAAVILDVNEVIELNADGVKVDLSAISPEKTTPVVPANNQKDAKGTADNPLLSRFPATHILKQYQSEYNSFMLATGPIQKKQALPPVLKLEGSVDSLTYQANSSKYSAVQVFRNYEKALSEAGFQPIFSCRNDSECGYKFVTQLYYYGDPQRQGRHPKLDAPNTHGDDDTYYYWSGKGLIQDKEVYVTLLVAQDSPGNKPARVVVDINELVDLNDQQISINLAGMQKDLAEQGKVVLDGVLFDTAKATLKPESREVVALIAQYLNQNPNDSFYVVGHTDSQGAFDMNMSLSQNRAKTVANTLVQEHGIAANRLHAVGVGPVSPVLSNATPAGRKENRRVEMVLKD